MRTFYQLSVILLLRHCFASAAATTYEICVTKRTSPSPGAPVTTRNIFTTLRIPQTVTVTTTPTLPGSALKKRSLAEPRSPNAGSLLVGRTNKQPFCPNAGKKPPPSWPAAVTCVGVVKSFVPTTTTKTAKTTTTITATTPTSTTSVTTTVTSTNTISTPDASTTTTTTITATAFSTSTPLTTTTTTTTTLITASVAASTDYAICGPNSNNYAGQVNNQGIDTAFSNNNQNYQSANTLDSSKEACCRSCAANPLCVVTAFEPQFGAGQQCFQIISTQDTCAARSYSLSVIVNNPPLAADGGYFVSNGNCGSYDAVSTS
ncbi:MAG: hypothetical protein Q9195_006528 [Heterodermia aff. obscurata]